ncbi:glycosyltransferase family 39 protein [Azovibrio restrictus]|uniref:glycosyltransferase family 39 protein n=1 Tax=Azovibrio restrictus TaxID=146938 RepID=UPI0026E92033|nr:glycosyltransferase family 39 protein [Azovibrio restrictus]MDD3483278.1 glycosyltransferase family 39 protein [Azovibrio restrictus]
MNASPHMTPSSPASVASPRTERWRTLTMALLLGTAVWLLHGSALQGFWRVDDPMILLYVSEQPAILGYFFSPAQWQTLGAPFFTPWLILDFRLDTILSGTDPQGFYLHHLAVLWGAALLTYLLLRRHTSRLWAAAAALLFLAGAPTAVVAQQLMSRHYATGLLFMILALYFWLREGPPPRWQHLLLGAACYLAAMLNKEVFAPLPLVLLLLGNRPLRERLTALLPYAGAALVFILWRRLMLGTAFGGYSTGFVPDSWLGSMAVLPQTLFGAWHLPALGALLLLILACRPGLRGWGLLIASAAALTLPFVSVLATLNIQLLRYLLLPWWALCVLLALGAWQLTHTSALPGALSRRLSPLLAVILLPPLILALLMHSQAVREQLAGITRQYDVQGRFVWTQDASVAYIPFGEVAITLPFQTGLARLKTLYGKGTAPRAIPEPLSARQLTALPLQTYDPAQGRMQPVPVLAPPPAPDPGLLRHIRIDRRQNGLDWSITDRPGSQCFLRFPGLQASFMVACAGRIHYDLFPAIRGEMLVLVRNGDQGWALSPVLQFPPRGQLLDWRAP